LKKSLALQRAWGTPGAHGTRSRACSVVSTRVSHHEYPGSPGVPARNGFNGFLRALPRRRIRLVTVVDGLRFCLSPVGPTCLRRLNTSNGCQDHTVLPAAKASFVCAPFGRSRVFRQPALRPHHAHNAAASTASSPASMTMANAPLGDRTAGDIDLSRVRRKQKYFCEGDWTRRSRNCPSGKSLDASSRRTPGPITTGVHYCRRYLLHCSNARSSCRARNRQMGGADQGQRRQCRLKHGRAAIFVEPAHHCTSFPLEAQLTSPPRNKNPAVRKSIRS
jgi:hypothetical protein